MLTSMVLLSSCGFQGRKYTRGYWLESRQAPITASVVKPKLAMIQDTIIPESKPTPLPLPLPQSKDTTYQNNTEVTLPPPASPSFEANEDFHQNEHPHQAEADIEKKISNTLKADFITFATPFVGWGLLRIFITNNSFYSIDSAAVLVLFTIGTLLVTLYSVSFILSLVWGFDTKSKLEKYFQNHPLYPHWKERSVWSIIFAFLGLLAPIISFILFIASFNY